MAFTEPEAVEDMVKRLTREADELRASIDRQSYEQLLQRWRFAAAGDPYLQHPVGDYYAEVMARKRDETGDGGVSASKGIGWDR